MDVRTRADLFANADERLLPGQFVNIKLTLQTPSHAVMTLTSFSAPVIYIHLDRLRGHRPQPAATLKTAPVL